MSQHGYTQGNSTSKTPDSSGIAWQRPFQSSLTHSIEPEADSQPDLQAQLETAQRMQVNWGQMKVGGTPSVIQTKLKVGAPGDQYEQEADRVAAHVMRMEAPELPREEQTEEEEVQTKPLAETVTPLVQREAEPEEEDLVQTKPDGILQREEGSEEEEAVQMQSLPIQREEMPEEEESLQAKLEAEQKNLEEESPVQAKANGLLQREALEDEESVQPLSIQRETASIEDEEPVQRQQAESSDEEIQTKRSPTTDLQRSASSGLESQLSQAKGGGSPLSDDVRSFMESRFHTDFSHVRVHTGSSAVQMNKDLNAQAFTHGSDVYFGSGKSPGQNELTAHELTHVIQQTGNRKPNKDVRLLRLKKDNNREPGKTKLPSRKSFKLNKQPEIAQSQLKSKTEAKAQSIPTPETLGAAELKAPDRNNHPGKAEKAAQDSVIPKRETPLKSDAPSTAKSGSQAPTTNSATQNPAKSVTPEVGAVTSSAAGGGTAPPQPESTIDVTEAIAGGSAEPEVEQTGEDKALEEVAAATEGVELDEQNRPDMSADLATIGESVGAEPVAGGGGGGAAIVDKPAPPVPDVSQAEPAQALTAISQLPPAQLQQGLGGVTAAVGTTVGKERADLAANPPQMERSTGSPMTKEGTGDRSIPAGKTPPPVQKAPQGQAKPTPQPQPLPPLPPSPIQSVPQPTSDPQAIKASLDHLPTRDPSLNITAGSPPPLNLQGDADPQHTQEQKAKLEKSLADSHAQGQQELAQPMGEDEIYPHVPRETLKAEGIGNGGAGSATGAGSAGGAVKGAEEDDAISIIAQQEHGQDIQAAVSQAQSQMAAKRQEHTVQVAQEKEKSNKEITKLQSENEEQQAKERSEALTEVGKQKEAWNKEQTDLVNKSRKDADTAVAKGLKDVQQEQTQAEIKAQQHIERGNQDAETARKQGEEQAATEKQKANQESGGIFGWLADKAKAFFDGIKQAIQKAFEIARAAVKLAIETAKRLATEAIEAARKTIVSIIKFVGDALIAIGDVLLAAFPEMRDRFRNAIKSAVKAAETAVNFLADTLKKGVLAALTLLGKGLDAALGLLEKGLLAAVDIAKAAVQGAIAAAKAAVDTLGAFAVLAKDIAANPGQWVGNLGAGVMDGIRNHLWTAFQAAVKDWFNQKVEEVLGLGLTVWNFLKKGGMSMAEVGKMAWEAIKAAIPPALIQILIEQLVALIVPAVGLVLKIIEGIQAAWGTVSRILQAMDRFMAFLKVVKSGQSGPQFGQLLAATGVILIDFAANWLLKKVRGAASKVAGKIKEIAKKIGAGLKGALAKLKKGAKSLRDRFLGRKGDKGGKGKDNKPGKDKEKDDLDKKQKKVDRAVKVAAAAVNAFAGKPVGKVILTPILQSIRVSFGLKSLEPVPDGENWAVRGEINPTSTITTKAKIQLGKGQVPKEGMEIGSSTTKKGEVKTQHLFANKNEAQNWAKKQLGQGAERIYDEKGKWIGWENKKGESVYWGHNDWGKGKGLSTYPHLNYKIGGVKGHLFLEDKIVNRGMTNDFMKELGL